jgi:O-glycosyl hydrolase
MNIKIVSISAKSVMICTAHQILGWFTRSVRSAEHVAHMEHMQKRSTLWGFGGETWITEDGSNPYTKWQEIKMECK